MTSRLMQCPHKCLHGSICCNNFVTSVDFQLVEHYMWWIIAPVRLVPSLFPVFLLHVVNTATSRQVSFYKFAQGSVVSVFNKLEINVCDSFVTSPSCSVKSITVIQMGYITTNEDIRHGVMSLFVSKQIVRMYRQQTAKSQGELRRRKLNGHTHV